VFVAGKGLLCRIKDVE